MSARDVAGCVAVTEMCANEVEAAITSEPSNIGWNCFSPPRASRKKPAT